MNRLTKIVLKNIYLLPNIFGRIYWYAAHPNKYSKEKKMAPIRRIVERAKKTGNLDIQVFGRENLPEKDGFILYPNHQGVFDGFAVVEACQRPLSAVMKAELMRIPAVKQIFQCLDAIPMDRNDVKQSVKVIQEVARRAAQGENWVIFPEGTRSREGNRLLEFKSGSFKAAQKAKCPIVPVALIDAYKPFDKNEPGFITVQIHILKPILYEEYKDMNTGEIAKTVKTAIEKTIAKFAP